MENNKDIKNQYDLLYNNISSKLEQQIESLNTLDTKASILLAVIGVMFAGYFQLFTCNEIEFKRYLPFVILEILSFVISGFFVFKAFILSKNECWRSDPNPKSLLDAFAKNSGKGEYWLKDQIMKNMSEAYSSNSSLASKKYRYFLAARAILYFGIIILVLHLVLSLFGIDKIIVTLKF